VIGPNTQKMPAPKTKKVLLIDPSPIFGDTLKKVIQTHLPYVEVLHTTNPDRLDSLLESESPDVVFLDICIFPKNVVQHIRSMKRRLPRGQVIVLTIHDSDEHQAAAIAGGADCFISKNHAAGSHLVDFVQAALK
jgi:DNA-binding NarL/FixJ family response regulator